MLFWCYSPLSVLQDGKQSFREETNSSHFLLDLDTSSLATEKAEKLNGKAAMLGMFALVGAYYFTGQILPGIF